MTQKEKDISTLDLNFKSVSQRACSVNFCRTFISSISIFLKLAGSTQPSQQTLLNPSNFYDISYICKVCLQSAKKWQLSE